MPTPPWHAVLDGIEPTVELRALWDDFLAQPEEEFDGMRFRRSFLDSCSEFRLLDELPDLSSWCAPDDRKARRRLFAEIAWVGAHADGGFVGYWHRGTRSLDGAPVVILEVQIRAVALRLVDYLANAAADAKVVAE